jgi:hypothetical protein
MWNYASIICSLLRCIAVGVLGMTSPEPPESAPLFEKKLTQQMLKPGQTAYFECKVSGYPPPEILWTRKGYPLVDKTRYKSTYDQYSGVTTLTIYNLCKEDEGEYTCTALNALGETSTTAALVAPGNVLRIVKSTWTMFEV